MFVTVQVKEVTGQEEEEEVEIITHFRCSEAKKKKIAHDFFIAPHLVERMVAYVEHHDHLEKVSLTVYMTLISI